MDILVYLQLKNAHNVKILAYLVLLKALAQHVRLDFT